MTTLIVAFHKYYENSPKTVSNAGTFSFRASFTANACYRHHRYFMWLWGGEGQINSTLHRSVDEMGCWRKWGYGLRSYINTGAAHSKRSATQLEDLGWHAVWLFQVTIHKFGSILLFTVRQLTLTPSTFTFQRASFRICFRLHSCTRCF